MKKTRIVPPTKKTKDRWAAGKADRAVLTSVNLWLWEVCEQAADPDTRGTEEKMGNRHPFMVLVNREADRLTKAIRAAVKETVRELPGRAQKGAVDAALRKVAPKLEKVLATGRKQRVGIWVEIR